MKFGSTNDTARDGSQDSNNSANEANQASNRGDKIDSINESQTRVGQVSTHASDPTAEQVGMNVEQIQKADPVGQTLAEIAAANRGVASDDSRTTVYSSHPIQNLSIGRFGFENATLQLNSKDVGEFEELLDKLPASERVQIKKISLDRVDEIVKARREAATQQFDSSVGRLENDAMRAAVPKVGTVDVADMNVPTFAHANLSQEDNNKEVVADAAPESTDDSTK